MPLSRDHIVQHLLAERPKFLALAWGLLRDAHSAEDVYQDLLVKAIEPEREFESSDHLRAWSWQVARNRSRELLRRQKSQVTVLSDEALELIAEETQGRDAETIAARIDALAHCVQRLTPNLRRIVELRYVEGLRAVDVAKHLGRKANAVYVSLSRIYRMLAKCVDERLAGDA